MFFIIYNSESKENYNEENINDAHDIREQSLDEDLGEDLEM